MVAKTKHESLNTVHERSAVVVAIFATVLVGANVKVSYVTVTVAGLPMTMLDVMP